MFLLFDAYLGRSCVKSDRYFFLRLRSHRSVPGVYLSLTFYREEEKGAEKGKDKRESPHSQKVASSFYVPTRTNELLWQAQTRTYIYYVPFDIFIVLSHAAGDERECRQPPSINRGNDATRNRNACLTPFLSPERRIFQQSLV